MPGLGSTSESFAWPPGRWPGGRDLPAGGQLFGAGARQLVQGYPHLLHAVPVADRRRVVLQAVEVDGDRQGGPDLVLAPVATSDRLSVVVLGRELLTELLLHPPGQVRELRLLGEW